ncbi:excinuclease ABC subunit UvrC [Thermosipho ferrireducens]|uniref:UvrABC system protein C n=1 Tax=Thermosipho ferrireducens TaxID=2571116 RepID=A0ABX7S906_9BACT|nr:excinuclease ABC subunit UvrC [Thermosipho ferrireducens]QTA37650.1 excinuclease ABC subunit UvrC [Thermosipho ferrireducens]
MLDRSVLNKIPEKPGVYMFKKNSEIIYIGKAKNLKKRISSHLAKREEKSALIVSESNEIETILVLNEREALLLEAVLIYKHKPKYNVMLKGAEYYPYIRISNDLFPYVEVVRNKRQSGTHFGPYTNVSFAKLLVEILQKIFRFRTCKKDLMKVKRSCMEYHLGLCSAPCVKVIDEKGYTAIIENLKRTLSGDFKFVREFVTKKMEHHARMLDFENAAKYRDMMNSFDEVIKSQGIILSDNRNVDYIAYEDNKFVVIKMRGGILLSKLIYEADVDIEEFLYQFYYGKGSDLPERIVIKDRGKLSFEIPITLPEDESDEILLKIAFENLMIELEKAVISREILKQMKEILGLKKLPVIIEGTDISHLFGKHTVASLVVFENGKPLKEKYRRYKLGNILDDYESLRVFVKRRYSKHEIPDLVFVDGGKGQVNVVKNTLKELGKDVPVVGLAKENETIVTENGMISLPDDHPVLRAFIKIRDETHRLANTYNQKLRESSLRSTILDSIEGIGPKRKKKLLKHFGTIDDIRQASMEELEKVIGKKLARRIKEEL